jgi:hypothetical protein
MSFLNLTQDNYNIFLGLLLASAAIMTVFKDWRILTPALVLQYWALAVIANSLNETTVRVMLGVLPLSIFLKGVAGLLAGVILLLTGYAILFEKRGHRLEEAENVAKGRGGLRRLFYQEEQATLNRFRYVDYLLPLGAVIIAAVAAYAFTTLLPFSGNFFGDFVFFWLGSIGVTVMVVGSDIIKLGVGLLVALNGADLLYSLLRSGDNPLVLGASAGITIFLALIISYLAITFFNKMKTLTLSERFQRRRPTVQ